jgi:hypothetical protein
MLPIGVEGLEPVSEFRIISCCSSDQLLPTAQKGLALGTAGIRVDRGVNVIGQPYPLSLEF